MRRIKLYRLVVAAAAISLLMPAVAAPAMAAEKAKPYVVVMAADPITAYDGGVARTRADEGDARQEGRPAKPGGPQLPGVPARAARQVAPSERRARSARSSTTTRSP